MAPFGRSFPPAGQGFVRHAIQIGKDFPNLTEVWAARLPIMTKKTRNSGVRRPGQDAGRLSRWHKEQGMKPRARLGMALLLLGGCNTANHQMDVQLPDFPKANPAALRSPASAPAGTPGTPAYVMLASPNGDNSQAVAQVHM